MTPILDFVSVNHWVQAIFVGVSCWMFGSVSFKAIDMLGWYLKKKNRWD